MHVEDADEKIYTTGEIALICKVAVTTVKAWIDSGKMKGYRIPSPRRGSKRLHRRVTHFEVKTFLVRFGMPVPREFQVDAGGT